jgi:hypothetical protein
MILHYRTRPAVSETVNISREAPVLDTASSTMGGLVTPDQKTHVPLNGRSLTRLLATTPGSWCSAQFQRCENCAPVSRFLIDGTYLAQLDWDLANHGYEVTKHWVKRAEPRHTGDGFAFGCMLNTHGVAFSALPAVTRSLLKVFCEGENCSPRRRFETAK